MKEITVDAVIDNVTAVTDFVNEELENADCSIKAQIQIDVAIDELFSNIARYAYGENIGSATVSVETDAEKASVAIKFIDSGMQYNPLEHEDPDTTLSADERGIGGLGIFIVKKTMNDVMYEYKDGKNILTILKNW